MRNLSFVLLLIVACSIGAAILWIDSRPSWDDTAITAGLIFISTATLGFIKPTRAWALALGVSVWIPVHGLVTGSHAPLLALAFGFAGAFVGVVARRLIASMAR